MNKSDKIVISFYGFLAISFFIGVFYTSSLYDEITLPDLTPHTVSELHTTKIVDGDKELLFNLFYDVEKYPKILPKNILSVTIINKTKNVIIAREIISEQGITNSILVRHTFSPYDFHIVEVLDGDAVNTKITQKFEDLDTKVKITTDVELKLKGLLSPFVFIPKSNLEHALDTVVNSFIQYGFSKFDASERTVDDIYREILLRPADKWGLIYYSNLLRNGTFTENDIRTELLSSKEFGTLIASNNPKLLNEINPETKLFVDSLYQEILRRSVDEKGLRYWSTLLEEGYLTKSELRKELLKSQEAIDLKRFDDTRGAIKELYNDLLGREPTNSESANYKYLVDIEEMTIEGIRKDLEETKYLANSIEMKK